MTSKERGFFRAPNGIKYYHEDLGELIAERHPELIGKHIFKQLDALGLRSIFDRSATPGPHLPWSFSKGHESPQEET